MGFPGTQPVVRGVEVPNAAVGRVRVRVETVPTHGATVGTRYPKG